MSTHPEATPIPEPFDLELDVEIAMRVYKHRWFDLGVGGQISARIIALLDPTVAGAQYPSVDFPECKAKGYVLTWNGEIVSPMLQGLPRPTINEADAWNLVRFLARERGVVFSASLHPPKDGKAGDQVWASWHRDEGPPDASRRTCVASHMNRSLCRAIARSALQLLDVLESGGTPGPAR